MAIFSKIFSFFMSVVMSIISMFGLGGEKTPEFVLGENVNSDVAQVLEVYNNAVIKTDEDAPLVKSSITLEDLFLGIDKAAVVAIAKPVINDILAETILEDYDIPGEGELKAEDVVSAKMSTEDGKTTVIIEVKDQAADVEDGPFSRAIGGSLDVAEAIESTGFVTSGIENIKVSATDCTIACIIDDATGEIIRAEWCYNLKTDINDITISVADTVIEISNASATIGFKSEL